MGSRWMVSCVVVAVVVVANLRNGVVMAEPQVQCYFIFGDSLVDNGNNNNIQSLARANFLPYGIDFPEGPTGRFSNGRTTVDVVGKWSCKHISWYEETRFSLLISIFFSFFGPFHSWAARLWWLHSAVCECSWRTDNEGGELRIRCSWNQTRNRPATSKHPSSYLTIKKQDLRLDFKLFCFFFIALFRVLGLILLVK